MAFIKVGKSLEVYRFGKRKYVHHLVKFAQEKVWLGELTVSTWQ